jgi:pyruvate,water dikinase
MENGQCLWFGDLDRSSIPIAGGKGANLGDMVQADFPIPPGFVICTPAYHQVVEEAGIWEKIDRLLKDLDRDDCDQLRDIEHQIRFLFEDLCIPCELENLITGSYRALGDQVPVAVRSSATAEDLAGASFAGQQETFLNVVGEEALLEAVCKCWSSLFTSQAIFYRCQRGFEDQKVAIAVVVQKMINSEKSGVIFTVDPVLRNHFYMIIEAVWGLGEGIVSGTITPDHYRIDRETYEIVEQFVPDKLIMICQDGDRGVIKKDVPTDKKSAIILTDGELKQLVDLGNRVQEHFGCPQDIEWGIENEKVYLLQSRPITSL